MPAAKMTDAQVWEKLREPIPDDVVNMRAAKKGGPPVIPYVNVGIVEDRLDNVLTPAGWNVEFRRLEEYAPALVLECKLTITLPSGEEVSKVDVGEARGEEEAVKSLYSDALKRAARRFGIARELGIKNAREATDEADVERPRRQEVRRGPRTGGSTHRQPEAVAGRQNPDRIENVGQLFTWASRKHGVDSKGVLDILGTDVKSLNGLTPARYAAAAAKVDAHFASQQPPAEEPPAEEPRDLVDYAQEELGAEVIEGEG